MQQAQNQNSAGETGERVPAIKQANLLFMLILLFYTIFNLLPLGLRAVGINFRISTSFLVNELIIEVGLLLLPTLVAIGILRLNPIATLNLRPISLKTAAICAGIGCVGWPIAAFVTLPVQFLLNQIGPLPSPITPATTIGEALVLLFILSVLAPVCEEAVNRGFIFSAYARRNAWHAVLVSGLFFGLFHMSPTRFLATAILGGVLGYVVYRTRSIFGSMIVHATHNGILFLLGQAAQQVVDMETATQNAQKMMAQPQYLLVNMIVLGGVSLVAGGMLYGLLQLLPQRTPSPLPSIPGLQVSYGYPPQPAQSTPYAPLPVYSVPAPVPYTPISTPVIEEPTPARSNESTNPFHYWTILVVLAIFILFSGLEVAVRAGVLPIRRPATPPTPTGAMANMRPDPLIPVLRWDGVDKGRMIPILPGREGTPLPGKVSSISED